MTYKLRFLYILLSLSLKDNIWFIKLIIIHILSYFPNLCYFLIFSSKDFYRFLKYLYLWKFY